MKYLKLYESSYYEEISKTEFFKLSHLNSYTFLYKEFSNREIDIISKFDSDNINHTKKINPEQNGKCIMILIFTGYKNIINIDKKTKILNISIYKVEDDYFLAEVYHHVYGVFKYYKCDQLGGLRKCLLNIYKKYK